jgi:hypothetical protein
MYTGFSTIQGLCIEWESYNVSPVDKGASTFLDLPSCQKQYYLFPTKLATLTISMSATFLCFILAVWRGPQQVLVTCYFLILCL